MCCMSIVHMHYYISTNFHSHCINPTGSAGNILRTCWVTILVCSSALYSSTSATREPSNSNLRTQRFSSDLQLVSNVLQRIVVSFYFLYICTYLCISASHCFCAQPQLLASSSGITSSVAVFLILQARKCTQGHIMHINYNNINKNNNSNNNYNAEVHYVRVWGSCRPIHCLHVGGLKGQGARGNLIEIFNFASQRENCKL